MIFKQFKFNFFCSLISGLIVIILIWFFKTERKIFLIQEVSKRDNIAQLVLNLNNKFQIVDVDSVLISNMEWDKVAVTNEDINIQLDKYSTSINLNGLILRYNKLFLKRGDRWYISDIFLNQIKEIEKCDSIGFFHEINNTGYAQFWYQKHIGLINAENGEKVIPADFLELEQDIYKNYKVKAINNKYGVINLNGNLLVAPIYDSVYHFSNDTYLAILGSEQNLILNGKKQFRCNDCSIGRIGSHFVLERKEGYQFLNKTLSFKSNIIDWYNYLSDDYFSFKKDGAAGVYKLTNSGGVELLPAIYKNIEKEVNGYWVFIDFYNKKGMYYYDKEIIPAQFDEIDLTDNYVFVKLNDKWGLWDKHNKREWITPSYYSLEVLSENLIKVNDGNGTGLLKKSTFNSFYSLLDCNYSDITDRGRYYELEKNGEIGIADINGKEIIPPSFSVIDSYSDDGLGKYFIAEKNNIRYMLDEKGSFIIPENFNFIETQGAGLALIQNDFNQFGWYNLETRQIQIKCKYEKVDKGFAYKQDIVRVYDGEEWINIDFYGSKRDGSTTSNKIGNFIDDGIEALEDLFK